MACGPRAAGLNHSFSYDCLLRFDIWRCCITRKLIMQPLATFIPGLVCLKIQSPSHLLWAASLSHPHIMKQPPSCITSKACLVRAMCALLLKKLNPIAWRCYYHVSLWSCLKGQVLVRYPCTHNILHVGHKFHFWSCSCTFHLSQKVENNVSTPLQIILAFTLFFSSPLKDTEVCGLYMTKRKEHFFLGHTLDPRKVHV